jgi:argininosuccinate lyase
MKAQQEDPRRPLAALLADASRDLHGTSLGYSEEALARILSPRHFVEVRRTLGGPAPAETARAAGVSRLQLEADAGWRETTIRGLAEASRRLDDRSRAL